MIDPYAHIPGRQADRVERDIGSGLPLQVTEENLVEVVRALVDIVQQDMAREIEKIGLFINERGETTRLSRGLIQRLQDEFDARYEQIP